MIIILIIFLFNREFFIAIINQGFRTLFLCFFYSLENKIIIPLKNHFLHVVFLLIMLTSLKFGIPNIVEEKKDRIFS